MSENKHSRSGGSRGYYIALILCAAAIGIASYVYNTGDAEPCLVTFPVSSLSKSAST